jgi:hypothetical protein
MTGASTYHPDTVRVKQTTLTLATLGVSFGCQGRRGWQGEKCKIAEHRLPPPSSQRCPVPLVYSFYTLTTLTTLTNVGNAWGSPRQGRNLHADNPDRRRTPPGGVFVWEPLRLRTAR